MRLGIILGRSRMVAALLTGTLIAGVAGAQEASALQDLRRHWLDAGVNVLTFHSVDQIFLTRRVDTGGSPWVIPRNEKPLDFTYEYAGKTHAATEVLDRTFTNALIIVKHGQIVAEIYRNQTSDASHFISFSMAKSLTSILIGIALADGSIHSLDDMITQYVPELKNSAYDGVTLRQALDMRSGADYHEVYVSDQPNLLATAFEESIVENRGHFADFARTMVRAYPPGEHFSYSTIEASVLGWVLERATKQSITQFTSERLWKPAGMESYGFWMVDGAGGTGREFTGGGFNAVARDYARLGLLMMRNGKAANRQVVPASWVRESSSPGARQAASPQIPGLGYHLLWWPLVGSDAYLALGIQGQNLYIDPDADTVVVKLSYVPPGNIEAVKESIAFLQAVSKWQAL